MKIFLIERSNLSRFHFQKNLTSNFHAALYILMIDIEETVKYFHLGCLSLIHLCSPPGFFLQLLIAVDYFWNVLGKPFYLYGLLSISDFSVLHKDKKVVKKVRIMLYKKQGKC